MSLQVPKVRASASQYDTALQVSDKVVHVSPWSASLLCLSAGDPEILENEVALSLRFEIG